METFSFGIIKKLDSAGTIDVHGCSLTEEQAHKNEKIKVVISSVSARCINGFKPSFFEY